MGKPRLTHQDYFNQQTCPKASQQAGTPQPLQRTRLWHSHAAGVALGRYEQPYPTAGREVFKTELFQGKYWGEKALGAQKSLRNTQQLGKRSRREM